MTKTVSLLFAAFMCVACVLPEVAEFATASSAGQPPDAQVDEQPSTECTDATTSCMINTTATVEATAGAGALGAAGTPPTPTSEPCQGSAARCTLNNVTREECVNGFWTEVACGASEVCSSNTSDPPGTCKLKTSACIGHGGERSCDAYGNLFACSYQELLESSKNCGMVRLCNSQLMRCDVDPCRDGQERCINEVDHWEAQHCGLLRRDSTTTQWQLKSQCSAADPCQMTGATAACK